MEVSMSKKIGVILAGNGYLDGAEIRESVLTLLAIDKCGGEVVMMAPDKPQHHVVDHMAGAEDNSSRNVLIESARIARGKIQNISEVNPDTLDALVMPGGFGVAKNLSNFAFEGAKGEMDTAIKDFILKIHNADKPIGVICISPAVICLALGDKNPEVTIGNDAGTAQAIEALGGKHIECKANEAHTDSKLKLVSTPAYMYDDAPIKDIAEGIEKCVQGVFELM
jgi:enhancing lycopene biosynthesis protein 2